MTKLNIIMTYNNNRNISYDLLRVVCMIWIVCIWHLTDYYKGTDFYDLIHKSTLSKITTISLAAFTLMSGLFLGKYNVENMKDIVHFYIKRLGRIYILFALSLFTLYFIPHPVEGNVYIKDLSCLAYSLVGMSMLKTPAPSTLWFVEMLLVFYFFTPILLLCKNRLGKKQETFLAILILLFLYIFSGGG